MRKHLTTLGLMCLAAAAVGFSLAADTLFVDAAATAGGDGSRARPFASPVQALTRLRTLKRGTPPVTLRFKAGDYYLPDGLLLDARDAHLRFVGGPGVRFTRAEKAVPGGIVKCAAARPPDSETYFRMTAHAPMFFYDGTWAVEARWPNAGWAELQPKQVVDSGLRSRCLGGIAPDKPTVPGSFRFDSDRPARWDFDAGVWLAGYTTHDWSFERVRLASFTPSNRLVRLAGSVPFGLATGTWSDHKGRRFYIYGSKAELDAPGEYYYDRNTGRVDFIAPSGGVREFLAVTREGPIVTVKGASDVTFEGIAFAYACGDGLRLEQATQVCVRDSSVEHVGGNGIVMTGGRGCRVERTEIAHCGLGGVKIAAGNRRTLTRADHVVADCEIHDFSRICRTYCPAASVSGCGVTVRGCRIHDAPHAGVIYIGNEHLFEGNEVWDILGECGDAGAFYTGRDPTSRGNVLRGNFVHDIGHPESGSVNTMAFYLDDCDAGDTLVSNRVVNVPRGVMIGGGHDNHLIGNVFERCNLAISVDARGIAWSNRWDSATDRSWQMTRKVKELPVGEEPWKSRYPLLVNYLNDGPREPRHISIVGNRFIGCREVWQWGMGMEKYLPLLDCRDNASDARVVPKPLAKGWSFSRDQAKWTAVTVPHDWAIEGPFDPKGPGGTGKLPWRGVGHYRRTLRLASADAARVTCEGARVYLEFDGVMARAQVRVNGKAAGGWDYGYMSFVLDVTALLKAGDNLVEVDCDTRDHHSRWYPGAGIYREVRLVVRPREHVVPLSLAITAPEVSREKAVVRVAYVSSVKGPQEKTFTISAPRLWDVDDPYLYTLELLGETFRYGIRTFRFTADDGFHLNGRRVQLKGVDLHSDLGPLGMAFDRDAMKRQLLIMKDMGVNALRTSHNAPDPKVLDLCDEMGIVVWDECFDKWDGTAGRRNDENLEAYVTRNLRQFVRRDRNHPSVVLWSIGNEIYGSKGWNGEPRTDGQNPARNAAFRAAIRELDVTRPVGNGNCHTGAIDEGCFADLDVTGWNYRGLYRRIREKYPDKPCVYSESASALSSFGAYEMPPAPAPAVYDTAAREVGSYDHNAAPWSDIPDAEFARMEEDRYCAGEFVWTGIDYLGEPTPYVHGGHFPEMKAIPDAELARSSYFGIVDLMGIPKDRFYIYRAHWKRDAPTCHIVPHWNWAGREGRNVPVYVYTDGDEGEIFLNGRSLGRRRKGVTQRTANLLEGATVTASSEERKNGVVVHPATDVLKRSNELRWCAKGPAKGAWWQADFGRREAFDRVVIVGESADGDYAWRVVLSDDGVAWRDYAVKPLHRKAAHAARPESARYVRVVFDDLKPGRWPSIRSVRVSRGVGDEAFRVNSYYEVCDRYRLRWLDVPYEPGELRAVSYRKGVRCGEAVVRTAGRPVAVRLTEDPYNAPEAKTRFVQVDLVDAAGTRDPRATDRVSFAISGPGVLAAVGNGNPRGLDSFKAVQSHPLYFGKAVAVVRRIGPGTIRLTARVPGLRDGTLELKR